MKYNLFLCLTLFVNSLSAQTYADDSVFIARLFETALVKGKVYQDLSFMCKNIGHRLSGSVGAAKAVQYTAELMRKYDFDTVHFQEMMVPVWQRGNAEQLIQKSNKTSYKVCALGGSVAGRGEAEVLEVFSINDLDKINPAEIKGKIVFFNRPMDPRIIHTFNAYGTCVDQRVYGAVKAAQYGAVAVVVRSMTLKIDDFPHTGMLVYADSIAKIPALAISTLGAENLSSSLKSNPGLKLYYEVNSKTFPDTVSHNVVGEMKGGSKTIIAVGGHLDSWDLGQGAHDDGAGCMQSIEALRLLKVNQYQPNNTLRSVMFMNEENGLRGGLMYAERAKTETHLAAIEADRGAFAPRGFFADASADQVEAMQGWLPLLEPYGIHVIKGGGAGADIGPLRKHNEKTVLIGFVPDSQRYFDFHHAETDTIQNVNQREVELGAAALAAIIYLIDKYGF
jgi:hypothetical protein